LQLQDHGADVQALQEFLNTHGALVAASGSGSPGSETDYFGSLTYQALIRFQSAHAAEILAPLGLSQGTGFFGAATRAYVNSQP
jgi:peptidoglycan hydrolase-like protein with peptidoglycan-binding domain